MAVIYIDNFETTLANQLAGDATELYLSSLETDRIAAAMGFSQYAPVATVGPLFMRLPLFLSLGEQRELVYATHVRFGAVHIMRTTGLAFGTGATLRCAPPAETVAAAHMVTRVGGNDEVIAAPGERGVLVTEGVQITVVTAATNNDSVMFRGDDWPAEVVIQPAGMAGARDVTFKRYDQNYGLMSVEFSLSGAQSQQSVLVIPEGCRMAVLTVRLPPVGARSFSVSLMVTAEFFV